MKTLSLHSASGGIGHVGGLRHSKSGLGLGLRVKNWSETRLYIMNYYYSMYDCRFSQREEHFDEASSTSGCVSLDVAIITLFTSS